MTSACGADTSARTRPRPRNAPEDAIVPSHDSAPEALRVEGLTRRAGRAAILHGIGLTLGRGEIMCLVGPSGCGKSSLLRAIAGVDAPDSGRILMHGREIVGPAVFVEPEQRGIGMMFQDYALFPHLTVAQNLAFGLRALPRAERQRRVQETLALIGIEALEGRHPHSLSGGEQQRVALARALAPRPVLLLMDEPFSNLDRGLRERLRDETVAQLRALGTATIIVTHDPEEALATGDRLAVMRAGRIVEEGPARALYRRAADPFTAAFLGPCTRLLARCRGGRAETPLGPVPAPAGAAEGETVLVLLRPEAVDPAAADGAEAEVVSVSFLGPADAVTLRLPGLEMPLQARAEPGTLGPGRRTRAALRPGAAMVFRQI